MCSVRLTSDSQAVVSATPAAAAVVHQAKLDVGEDDEDVLLVINQRRDPRFLTLRLSGVEERPKLLTNVVLALRQNMMMIFWKLSLQNHEADNDKIDDW
jgi:hypothetical protein